MSSRAVRIIIDTPIPKLNNQNEFLACDTVFFEALIG